MSAELLNRARDGDRDAFSQLLEAHYDFIHAIAWRWCGVAGDAEDIAQEACIRMARAIRDFKGQSGLKTWLYTLTLNVVRDHQRQMARRRRDENRLASDPVFLAERETPDGAAEEWLWAAVRTLPDKQRDAVLLVHAEGLSHAAAADVLGCSEKTISWHLHDARKRLKDLLKKEAV